ncbi:unnamed protein product [Heligmosomoides polygyrus]|uniref:Uncharacterized protein n=1 Tax=Heligmosomoides polygyrus TaxID=6339 RepID=A0A183FHT3_HELPZ|nr:unnamed protein product [Heligmosomoides polygyrus]
MLFSPQPSPAGYEATSAHIPGMHIMRHRFFAQGSVPESGENSIRPQMFMLNTISDLEWLAHEPNPKSIRDESDIGGAPDLNCALLASPFTMLYFASTSSQYSLLTQ